MNKIVKIIHSCAQLWDGKPTKNYGERYMITWKLPGYEHAVDGKGGQKLIDGVLGSEDRGNSNSGHNDSGRMLGDDEQPFGKPASGDASLNMSSKIDERTSLIPDGKTKG